MSKNNTEGIQQLRIHPWILNHEIKNEQGTPLDFKQHLFLYDIFNDYTQRQVINKAAQIGFSTTAIVKQLWACKSMGMDSIYTLPTVQDSRDFVAAKVNRIIQQNPVLQTFVKEKDSVDQKQVGDNFVYYKGTWTERAAIMVTSDLNIYDEVDRSKQSVISQYSSRLQHSKYKFEWMFSNPSVPGNGVDKWWCDSDQKHWFIKCQACNKKQFLDWPDNIDMERQIFICKHCKKELTSRRVGEWVKKFRGKDISGYWISLLMAPWVSAKEIITLYKTKPKEFFWNFVLGQSYVGEGNIVTPDVIFRNLTSEVIQPADEKNERIVIGVDTGLPCYYVVGNEKGLFYYGSCDGYSEIESLLKRYSRAIAVLDGGGDLVASRALREKYPGRVFLCHYSVDRKTMQLIRWGKNDEEGNVIADRNRLIQLVIDEFADKRIKLQGSEEDWYDYYLHWKNMYKMKEENSLGVIEARWERSGDDHWAHASVYWRIGMDRFGFGNGTVYTAQNFLGTIPMGPEIIDDTINPFFNKPSSTNDWRTL